MSKEQHVPSTEQLFRTLTITLFVMLFASRAALNAQGYVGFTSDNYAGVHSVLVNPANIADSKYAVDINLASISGYAGSDLMGIDFFQFVNDFNYDLKTNAEFATKEENNIYGNVDFLGPAFQFNLGRKYSVGLSSRARVYSNINSVNGELVQNAWNKFENSPNLTIDENNFNATIHGWTEFALTLGAIVYEKKQHFLKGGLSLKYIRGLGALTIDAVDSSINFRENGEVTTKGEANLIRSNGLNLTETLDYSKNPSGIAADIGFVYEYRPESSRYTTTSEDGEPGLMQDKSKYSFKIGFALTDIGTALGYEQSTLKNYNLNKSYNISDIVIGDLETNLDAEFIDDSKRKNDVKILTPTTLNVNVDWRMRRKIYININTDLSLRNGEKIRSNRTMSNFTLTPRYESKWVSIFTPLGLRQQGDFAMGIGLRAGPVFMGSGSVFSNLINKTSKTTDLYVGVKIPIYRKSTGEIGPEEEKEDDNEEENEASNADGDLDDDGVLDNVDKCPEVPGLAEDDGCPPKEFDRDGDGVIDDIDECPTTPGLVSLGGCPDSDGDGVPDIDDVCVNVPGLPEKYGCPEQIQKVTGTIDDFANVILFKYGKSSFQEVTYSTLNSIVEILDEYPTSIFSIEGHTDNSGSKEMNMRLSEDRASAVRDYLVANGISSRRLFVKGFGEDQPLTSNDTEEGRMINRRVIVKLISVDRK